MTTLTLQSRTLDINGLPARVALTPNVESGAATVFVHGGAPGLTPYCGGAHIWGDGLLRRFAQDGAVLALDLPGFGGSKMSAAPYSMDTFIDHIDAAVRTAGIRRCHLVAHDSAGLAALLLACRQPDYIASVSVVSSVAAAPTGDGVENVALAHPPRPLWSRESQKWALERLSYSHHHVPDLLDDCVAAARQAPHQAAVARMADADTLHTWNWSVARAKARLFELCRGPGVPVPVQVVWGTHDPLGTIDQGLWLYRILAQRQPIASFHLINRSGALPFREEPDAFHATVSAFSDAIA